MTESKSSGCKPDLDEIRLVVRRHYSHEPVSEDEALSGLKPRSILDCYNHYTLRSRKWVQSVTHTGITKYVPRSKCHTRKKVSALIHPVLKLTRAFLCLSDQMRSSTSNSVGKSSDLFQVFALVDVGITASARDQRSRSYCLPQRGSLLPSRTVFTNRISLLISVAYKPRQSLTVTGSSCYSHFFRWFHTIWYFCIW